MKIPWWLATIVVGLLIFAVIDYVRIYIDNRDLFGDAEEAIEAMREARAERDVARQEREEDRQVYEAGIAELAADTARLQEELGLADREVARARESRNDAGATLTEYLENDSRGMELLNDYHVAVEQEVSLERHRAEILEDENVALRQSLVFKDRIIGDLDETIAGQDSTITAYELRVDVLLEDMRALNRKANPPFHVKLFKTSLECGAAGLAGWAASKEPAVGVAAGGGCALVKWTLKF